LKVITMSDIKLPICQDDEAPKPSRLLGARHLQFFLMSFTLVIFFGMRTALSVGIIAMIEENPPSPDIPTYPEWTGTDTILSSFFWGYLVTQIVAGQLSEYFGAKWFLVGTMLLGSVFNVLIPVLASCWGSGGVILCRVVQGLAQGFLYPCILNIVSKWTPLFERSRVSSFVYGGASVGIVTSMPLTGAIAGSTWGWPVACYLYGGLGVLWTAIFAVFAADSPATHRCVSTEERLYIESSTSVNKNCTKVGWRWCRREPALLVGVFAENPHSLEVHLSVAAHVGHLRGELRGQLGLLHAPHRDPQLHGQHHGLQHKRK
jgi:ACS family sodium-dependent inorganic phosphate cotransporter-like MFS transporter 6/7/8